MTEYTPGMSPEEFFEQVVPAMAAKRKDELDDHQKSVTHSIAMVLSGVGGGEWTLSVEGGDVTVTKGVSDGANPVFLFDAGDWEAVMSGEIEAFGSAQELANFDVSLLKPDVITKLEPIKGTLRAIIDDDDAEMEATVKFGPGAPDEPTCTITIDGETARAMQTGALNPQMAFMNGKVKIAGDMALAMQVAALQM